MQMVTEFLNNWLKTAGLWFNNEDIYEDKIKLEMAGQVYFWKTCTMLVTFLEIDRSVSYVVCKYSGNNLQCLLHKFL